MKGQTSRCMCGSERLSCKRVQVVADSERQTDRRITIIDGELVGRSPTSHCPREEKNRGARAGTSTTGRADGHRDILVVAMITCSTARIIEHPRTGIELLIMVGETDLCGP